LILLLANLNTGEVLGQLSVTYRSQPLIRNFPKEEYQGANQNWSIAQDKNGVLFFGNTYGLLEFNGADWILHTHPDITLVRSVYADTTDGKIYVGSFEEFGYWQRNSLGELNYNSLSQQLLDEEDLSNVVIWKIFRIGKYLYLHSYDAIFRYDGEGIETIEDDAIQPMFEYKGKPFVSIMNRGLFSINEDFELHKESGPDWLSTTMVKQIFEVNNDTSIVFTENKGLYLKIGETFIAPRTPGNGLMETYQIDNVLKINEQLFAIGTRMQGVLITDIYGNIISRLDKSNGLQHNTVLSLSLDINNNLWIGMNKGIDFIKIVSPFSIIEDKTGELGSVTSSVLFQNKLYLATNHGLFHADWNKFIQGENTEFVAVAGMEGHVLSLDVIDGQLLCGFNLGTYRIEGNRAIRLSYIGGHHIQVHPYLNNIGYQGIYTGIALYEKDESGLWDFAKIIEDSDHIRYLHIDHEGNLWASGFTKDLKLYQLNEPGDSILYTHQLKSKDNFISDYYINVFNMGNRPVFTNAGSFFTYDYLDKKIIPYSWLNDRIGKYSDAHIIYNPDPLEYWFINRSSLRRFDYLFDSLVFRYEIKYDYIHGSAVEYSENISKLNERYYTIGLHDGFAMLDYNLVSDSTSSNFIHNIQINSFLCSDKSNSTKRISIDTDTIPKIRYRFRNLLINYSVPGTTQELFNFYYRFTESEPWSDLGNNNVLRYDNLRSGSHLLEIKAVHEVSGKTTSLSFPLSVLHPWYLQWISIVTYLIIIAGLMLLTRKVIKIRLNHQKREYFEKVRYESEKKMIEMKQEYLQKELKNKSKELVNYTILLDKRNESMNRLKSLLSKEMENPGSSAHELILKLIHIIDQNLSNRNDWQTFKSHFDAANTDFLEKLRNIHHNLTPSDLRFCGFLRMNLTSKEIASLLSISLRSIEVKRYRLRKKLSLEHEQNLIEYLMNI
jgi:DNA-binding CsgD family transcriptional regulator